MNVITDPSKLPTEDLRLVATACAKLGIPCMLHQVRESQWIWVTGDDGKNRYFSPLTDMNEAMWLLYKARSCRRPSEITMGVTGVTISAGKINRSRNFNIDPLNVTICRTVVETISAM